MGGRRFRRPTSGCDACSSARAPLAGGSARATWAMPKCAELSWTDAGPAGQTKLGCIDLGRAAGA
eukprot:8912736-Pyramimonas_sp.AAC.1